MRNSRASVRLAAPDRKATKPLAERGRMLFVRDVLELLPKKPDGSPVKGTWWVRNSFAPEHKHRLGRDPYWWECDAVAWLDAQGAA